MGQTSRRFLELSLRTRRSICLMFELIGDMSGASLGFSKRYRIAGEVPISEETGGIGMTGKQPLELVRRLMLDKKQ